MNNWGSSGIAAMIVLISIILVAIIATSVITGTTTDSSSDSSNLEDNVNQIVDETLDEICTYLQIKDQKGKYSKEDGSFMIQKIALLISPLVSQDIDVSQLTIQLNNKEIVKILHYEGNASKLSTSSLFEHSIWDKLDGENYAFITVTDMDNSLEDFSIINANSDNCYLIFKLPINMRMEKYDEMILTLFPSTGISRTTILKAPMPMNSVITFE